MRPLGFWLKTLDPLTAWTSATVSDQIRDEIQDAPFFGWQVDETTDISYRAQLSVIVRYVDSAGCSRLPRNAPTRWNFTSRIVSTVANNYDGLLQTFENIIADTTMDDDTLDCAKGFVRKLEDFEFVFMLYTYEQIFSETDVVFDIVQQRAMDVLYCKKRIESLLAFVKEKSSEGAFQAVYAKTADLTSDPRDEPMRKRRLTQLQDPQE
ncbi:unnamed protein product [Leuciscus chuanchicus]